MRGLAVLALALAVLTGCRWGSGGRAFVPTSHEGPHVGSIIHAWSQGDPAERDAVEAMDRAYPRMLLITTDEQWRLFRNSLPPSLRTADTRADLDRVGLRHSVVVIATYGRCTEVSHLESPRPGEIDLVVTSDPAVNCAWSPTQFEVWRIGLDELGVTDKGDVRIDPWAD